MFLGLIKVVNILRFFFFWLSICSSYTNCQSSLNYIKRSSIWVLSKMWGNVVFVGFLFWFEVWKTFWNVIGLGWQKNVQIGKCHCLNMEIAHDVFQVILAIMVITSSWCMEDVANSWNVLMENLRKWVKIWEARNIIGEFLELWFFIVFMCAWD
jgi:hypothetical protein